MAKVKIIDAKGIYFGEDNFDNGEIVDVISWSHDGEGQVLEVFSNKSQCSFRIFGGELSSVEVLERPLHAILHECVTTMQKIKFICDRAKIFEVEESDIDEILELLKGQV